MKISWKDTAEGAGIAAIVLSLIVLIFEVRQNTTAIRSGVIQSVMALTHNHQMLVISDPTLREAFVAARAGTETPDQRSQLDTYYLMNLQTNINRFEQMRLGMIDKNFVLANGGNSAMYRHEDFGDYWDREKDRYPAGFQQYVQEVLLGPIVYDLE